MIQKDNGRFMKKILTGSNPFLQKSLQLYGKHKKYVPLISFLTGFSWDSLTLYRIDRLSDNLTLLGYLLLLGISIILFNLVEKGVVNKPLLVQYKEWYPLIIQFLLGGLFSAYVIFYFHSASLSKTALFLMILIVLLIANEFLKDRLSNIYLQMSLYFFASFSFFTFFLPVITKVMNIYLFILGGFLSLGWVTGGVHFLLRRMALKSREQYWRIISVVFLLYILLNMFYLMNWIPPVPLSLREGGIFHHAKRIGDQYHLAFEKPKWYQFFKDSDDSFHYLPGDTVFCFVAVFAPTELQKKIYHHWQKYVAGRDEWLTTDQLDYPILGGRHGGYRGITYKTNITAGDWRVSVKTGDNLLLGLIDFSLIETDSIDYELTTVIR